MRTVIRLGLCLVIFASLGALAQDIPKSGPKPSDEVQALLTKATALRTDRKFEEALKTSQDALKRSQELGDKAGEAASHYGMGRAYQGLANFADAIKELDVSMNAFSGLGDKDNEAVATSDIGVCYYRLRNLPEAKRYFELALPKYVAAGNTKSENGMMMNIAIITENMGDPKSALAIYEKLLPKIRASKDESGEANLLANIGLAWGKLDDREKELAYLQQGYALEVKNNRLPQQALALGNIGVSLRDQYRLAEAMDYYTRSHALYKQLGDKRGQLVERSAIAKVYYDMGKLDLAREKFEELLPEVRAAGDERTESDICISLGIIVSRSGNYEQALTLFHRSLEIDRKQGDKFGVVNALNNLGYAYADGEQHEMAKATFEEALQLARELGSVDDEARSLNGLGGVARNAGDSRLALQYYLQTLPVLKKLEDKRALANVYGNISNVEIELKQFASARDRLVQALGIFRAAGDKHGEANMLIELADVDTKTGKPAAGIEQLYTQSIAASRAVGNREYESNALYWLGRLERKEGKKQSAVTHLGQSVDLLDSLRSSFGRMRESQSGFLARKLFTYYAYLDALLDVGKTNEAFSLAQKTKARALLDVLESGNVDFSADLTPDERQQEAALQSKAEDLNRRMVREGVENNVGAKKRYAALKQELGNVEIQLRRLTESLYARHPGLADRRLVKSATAEQISRTLPTNTALLEYVAVSDSRIVLFVTANGRMRAHTIKADYPALIRDAAAFRAACADPRSTAWRPLGVKLYALLVAPAAGELSKAKRLVICPDGPIWDVPFQALAKKPSAFMADRFDICYAYSATGMLASLRAEKRKLANNSLLVFANPSFGSTKRFGDLDGVKGQRPFDTPSRPFDAPSRPIDMPSRPIDQPSRPIDQPSRPIDQPSRSFDSLSRGGMIASLPGTQREANLLSKQFAGADIFTMNSAQENLAKQIAGRYRYLHFATHGVLNDAAPMLSSIVLAQPPAGSKDDGFLTAREISQLDLHHTEMATLSACNTARGVTRNGEGVIGLTWALTVAGVRTQIVSQWAVDDASTATLMGSFYSNLSRGAKSTALHRASLSLRNDGKHSHPYYWAPFVLVGDWR